MMIKKCVCKHDYQDRVYGPQMRACNEKKDGTYRCTVCGKDILGADSRKK